jgi:hypothetical protein
VFFQPASLSAGLIDRDSSRIREFASAKGPPENSASRGRSREIIAPMRISLMSPTRQRDLSLSLSLSSLKRRAGMSSSPVVRQERANSLSTRAVQLAKCQERYSLRIVADEYACG